MKQLILTSLLACILACDNSRMKVDHQIIEVPQANGPIILDGISSESHWDMVPWMAIDQNWVGPALERDDFNGRYKVAWDKEQIYLLVEIEDDSLYDGHDDPLKLWWDDDCVEIFIDEDNSGGLHQFSHNAFAYHVALDSNVVDLGPDMEPHLFNDHVQVARTQEGKVSVWEMAIGIFPDSFNAEAQTLPVRLQEGKKIGFALAYCDNDGSTERENFIGSVFVPGEDKNQGWINADIFGTLVLK